MENLSYFFTFDVGVQGIIYSLRSCSCERALHRVLICVPRGMGHSLTWLRNSVLWSLFICTVRAPMKYAGPEVVGSSAEGQGPLVLATEASFAAVRSLSTVGAMHVFLIIIVRPWCCPSTKVLRLRYRSVLLFFQFFEVSFFCFFFSCDVVCFRCPPSRLRCSF